VQVIKTQEFTKRLEKKLPKESNQKLSYKKPQAQLAEVVVRESEKQKQRKNTKKLAQEWKKKNNYENGTIWQQQM